MKLPAMSTRRGVLYVLRGLRQGRPSVIAMGVLIVLSRFVMGSRRRGGRSVNVKLAPGESVGLRVNRPGDDPVNFRVR